MLFGHQRLSGPFVIAWLATHMHTMVITRFTADMYAVVIADFTRAMHAVIISRFGMSAATPGRG